MKPTENLTTAKSRDEVIELLQKKYPKLDAVESEQFDGSKHGIWIKGTENGVTAQDEFPLFDYYTEDYREVRYVLGIHKEFLNFVEPLGWMAEWYDAGTIVLY